MIYISWFGQMIWLKHKEKQTPGFSHDSIYPIAPRSRTSKTDSQASGFLQHFLLTHRGLVTPFGDKRLSQHWLQAITWTNVDLSSVKSCGIHPRVLSWEDLKIPISKHGKTRLKIPFLESHSVLPGTNELICKYFFLQNAKLPEVVQIKNFGYVKSS